MTWLRVDDGFVDHPKIVSLGSPAARWAFLELLAYCARHHTDGYIPNNLLTVLPRVNVALINRAIEVGLVDRDETGDLRVHDWQTYNPPQKDPTGALRQQRWRNGQRNATVTAEVTPRAQPRARDTVPNPKTKPEGSNVNEKTYDVTPLTTPRDPDQPDTTTDEHLIDPEKINYQPKEIPW